MPYVHQANWMRTLWNQGGRLLVAHLAQSRRTRAMPGEAAASCLGLLGRSAWPQSDAIVPRVLDDQAKPGPLQEFRVPESVPLMWRWPRPVQTARCRPQRAGLMLPGSIGWAARRGWPQWSGRALQSQCSVDKLPARAHRNDRSTSLGAAATLRLRPSSACE